MLERFYVPSQAQERVSERALRTTVVSIFEAMVVPPEGAAAGADTLVTADLRGIETHGVSNMLRRYVGWYRAGNLNPTPSRVIAARAAPA